MAKFLAIMPSSHNWLCQPFLAPLTILAGAVALTGCSTRVEISRSAPGGLPRRIDVAAIASGWKSVESGTLTPAERDSYNSETRRIVSRLTGLTGTIPERHGKMRSTEGEITIRLDDSRIESLDGADAWTLADTIEVKTGLREMITVEGAGVPVIIRYPAVEEGGLIPESGLWTAVTALAVPENGTVTIRLVDPSRRGSHLPHGVGLAANYTAALARDFYGRQRLFPAGRALLNFDRFAPRMGMERVLSQAPEKRPVVLVHGIFSSALTWSNMINELMADQEIREHYEFWTFSYPTGAPVPYLAWQLRKSVASMIDYRKMHGAAHENVTVIGHSMGGLMAKTLTQSSGAEQWGQMFQNTPQEVGTNLEERAALRDMFFFEPIPEVRQVIFVSTPHHGIPTLERPSFRLLDAIIRAPSNLEIASQEIRLAGQELLTPLGREVFVPDFPNSIEHMRDDSKLGEVFDAIPLNPKVAYYSLIASKDGLDVPKEEMTDGIVEYASAHLQGAAYEKIFHSGHSLHRTPEAIAETARILKSRIRR